MGLANIEELLRQTMGLSAVSIGSPALARAVRERLAAHSGTDLHAYWTLLGKSGVELQELIEAVVVPETWFFRDRESFAALSELIGDRTGLSAPAEPARLLSLPCSTGEEPYSMAMALLDAGVAGGRFRVVAVDISARALARAARAVYRRNSFRGSDLGFRDRHFTASAHGYRLHETVRRLVHFQQSNLFDSQLLPGQTFDVIFCRNVLIYFDRSTQDRAIAVLQRLLAPNGVLIVAPAETALPTSHGLVSAHVTGAFAFRRAPRGPARAKHPARVSAAAPLASGGCPQAPQRAMKAPPPPSAARPPLASGPSADVTADLGDATRLANEGHLVEAAASCAAHLRRHGPSSAAFYLMGLVRDAMGNLPEAREFYRKALYLDPNHGEAQLHMAFLMERQGDAAGGRALRNRALRLQQKMQAAHD